MRYLESPSNDAYFNMALEEYVFEALPRDESYFMLWQNERAVVVGKYQNALAEIDADYVRANHVSVVRRLSGGGAMYQDIGNLNFTFVVDQQAQKNLDFDVFIQPVITALGKMGVTAMHNSRNDIVIDGKKFSGNAQYNRNGRTMHHGTLLFNADLSEINRVLRVSPEKIASKGVESVRSRVTNICSYLQGEHSLETFKKLLVDSMFDSNKLTQYDLTPSDLEAVQELRETKYSTWEWNYGHSPEYAVTRRRRFDFGLVEIGLTVKEGRVRDIGIFGDFFGNGNIAEVENRLKGEKMRQTDIRNRLGDIDVDYYINGMDADLLAGLIATI